METLWTMILQVHEHPVSIPHLSPSDCHLFRPLKEVLRSWKTADDDAVKEAVRDGFTHNLKPFILTPLKSL
jgi:hypothetical protein